MGSIITRFAETAALLLMPVMTALAQIEEVATTDSIGIGRVKLSNGQSGLQLPAPRMAQQAKCTRMAGNRP